MHVHNHMDLFPAFTIEQHTENIFFQTSMLCLRLTLDISLKHFWQVTTLFPRDVILVTLDW
jgi:hypothetical protein